MERFQQMRIIEAMLFASAEPVAESMLRARMPDNTDVAGMLADLHAFYANRGIALVRVGEAWAFRTAPDLAEHLRLETDVLRKLSRAAVETLAIIAYHQPVTRAEIEEIRGVALSRGTLDILLEAKWIRPRGRRRAPGKPITWGTTQGFLDHFGLESLESLPGVEELKAAGLLDRRAGLGMMGLSLGDGAEADTEPAEEPEEPLFSADESEMDQDNSGSERLARDTGKD